MRLVPAKLSALFALEEREHAFLYSFGYFGARNADTVWLWAASVLAAVPLLVLAAVAGCALRDGVAARVLVPSRC